MYQAFLKLISTKKKTCQRGGRAAGLSKLVVAVAGWPVKTEPL